MSRAAAWRSQPLSFNLIILSANFSGVNPATWDGISASASPSRCIIQIGFVWCSLYTVTKGDIPSYRSPAERIFPCELNREFNMRDYEIQIKIF